MKEETNLKSLKEAAEPFISLLAINDRLPPQYKDDSHPLYDKIPRVWPTYGDLRRLVQEIEKLTR